MRAKLAPEVERRVIAAAARMMAGYPDLHFETRRLFFTRWCCKTRMVKVRRLEPQDKTVPYSESNKRPTGNPIAVCQVCTKAYEYELVGD